METLDFKKFRRSNTDLLNCFDIKDNTTLVKKDISIIFPERYIKKGLCNFRETVMLVCIFAILDKTTNTYCKCIAPVRQSFTPTERSEVVIEDELYIELKFYKGDVFTPFNDTVKESGFLFTLFELFFLQGKVPIYVDYIDLGRLFIETTKYTGVSGVGDSAISNEIMATMVSRDSKNLDKFFKNTIVSLSESDKVTFIGLNDTFYGYDNTASRLIGNYLNECIVNSIIDPEKEPNKIGYVLQQ